MKKLFVKEISYPNKNRREKNRSKECASSQYFTRVQEAQDKEQKFNMVSEHT